MNRNTGRLGPCAEFVNGLGGQLFAGAGFPGDQDRNLRGGGLADLPVDLVHGGGSPDHTLKGGFLHLGAQQHVHPQPRLSLDGGFNEQFELFVAHRQQRIMEDAGPQGLVGDLEPSGMGEKKNLGAGALDRDEF